ncbi:MAG: heavy metal-binding domain-containing protein [Oligoflexia bacterium]|nr:heavy metal-binding domain-containing protein [Oligoflexia bacterium]
MVNDENEGLEESVVSEEEMHAMESSEPNEDLPEFADQNLSNFEDQGVDNFASEISNSDVLDESLVETSDPFAEQAANDELPLEALLSAEVSDSEVLASPTALEDVDCLTKNFSLRLLPENSQEIEKAKSIVESIGISLGERVWVDASPFISKLTEFQLIRLVQEFKRTNLLFEIYDKNEAVAEKSDALSVEAILEENKQVTATVDGAPSVTTVDGKSSILFMTSNTLDGYKVIEVVDLVSAHCSIPRNFFNLEEMEQKIHTEMKALLRSQKIKLPPTRSDQLIRDLQEEIQYKALAKGANAVINIKIQFFVEANHLDKASDQIRIVALGTAAIVDKSENEIPDELVADEA